MDDTGAGPSQLSQQVSQSILQAPGSPDFLNPESPGTPDTLQNPESPLVNPEDSNQAELQNGDSETFTQNEPAVQPQPFNDGLNDENTNDSSSTITYDRENTDSNDSTTRESVESNSQSLPEAILNIPRPGSSVVINLDENSTERACVRKSGNDENEPPSKIRKLTQEADDVDGETCPICLDNWSTSGEHRLVALKCGHLFGFQCVERWLKGQPAKDRSCPTCKSKTLMRDIRTIYARRLVAADTSQISTLQKQIDTLQSEKNRVELELQKSRIAHRACAMQLEVLRSTLMKTQLPKEQPVRRSWRFALEKNLEIFKDGGCRVLTYNCRTYELYVSQKSVNYLFPGYGIRKVSCVDYKLGQFVHLHPKPIRDITYSQPRDLLLSVGLDGSARIVERGILSVTVQSGVPLWSCSWDYLRSNEFYVGGVGGVVHQYDVRNPSTFLQRLQAPGDMSPVVSLCSTGYGLLSCQLNSCWLWMYNMRRWEPRALPIEGPFMSLCYDNDSHRALVSCRAGSNGERSRLALCKLKTSVTGEIMVESEQMFTGSSRTSLMSRASFVKAPGASWIAAHSESDSALHLHGLDGARTMSLPASEPALDVAGVQLNGDTLVAALSESRLRLYKAVSTNS